MTIGAEEGEATPSTNICACDVPNELKRSLDKMLSSSRCDVVLCVTTTKYFLGRVVLVSMSLS
jgi:hypothetical protein